ncbi:MAG TPA: YciI family protein [Solirubrobacterales bacterium]|nr:YciI family protein [Solirubrobacterales bacterium]
MRYLFALISDEGGTSMEDASPEEAKAVMDRWDAYGKEAVANGAFIAAAALQPSPTATTVRIKQGEETIVTDGPFAESKEQLGGFYLFECKDLDEALDYAKRIPFQDGTVEVRPVMDFSEYGYDDPTPGPVKATA